MIPPWNGIEGLTGTVSAAAGVGTPINDKIFKALKATAMTKHETGDGNALSVIFSI